MQASMSAPRLRERYDWVVLGDSAGALLSACLASRLGQSVIVVPLVEGVRTSRSAGGQVIDPETNAVYGLREDGNQGSGLSGLLARSFDHLGLDAEEWRQLELGGAAPQVVGPSRRVVFWPKNEALKSELSREFGQAGPETAGLLGAVEHFESVSNRYWQDYPEYLSLTEKEKIAKRPVPPLPRSLSGGLNSLIQEFSRSIEKQVSEKEKAWLSPKGVSDRSLKELGAGVWNSVSGQERESASGVELLQMIALARSAARVKGGMTAYRLLLASIARRLGAHVLTKNECRRIFIENGKFVGAQAAGIPSMIAAGAGVIDMPLIRVKDRIEFSGKHKSHDLSASSPATGWRFTVALTVSSDAVVPGTGNRVVWQETAAPAVEFEWADPLEYSITEKGQRLLFLRTTLPFKSETLAPEFQRMTAARMLRQASEVFPFLETHLIRIFPDFRENTVDFEAMYRFASLDEIPYNLLRFGGEGLGSRSGIEGLMLVSDESFPRLGQFGGTVAAVESVAWLAQSSGISGPMAVSHSVV